MARLELTTTLAGFLADARNADIPQAARHEAALRMMDSLGVAYAGRDETGVRLLLAHVPDAPTGAGVPVIGHGRRVDVRDAALLNGTMGHILDFDDSVLPSRLHPSAGLTAGLLTLGYVWEVSGDDLALGFLTGFEVAVRLADAIHPPAYAIGWHNAGVITPVAVAAGLMAMRGADASATEHALGIAASQSGGLIANRGSMTKALHTGRGTWSGVMSALLALDGFTSRPGALDDEPGGRFLELFGGSSAKVDLEGLGTHWSIARSAIKPYACGVVAHPAIDAAIALRQTPGFRSEDVRGLVITVPPVTMELMGDAIPSPGLEAKFSVPYVVAAALVHGHGGPTIFDEGDVLGDDQTAHIMRCISVELDDSLDQDQARLTLETTAGSTESVFVPAASGSVRNPIEEAGIREKFRTLFASAGQDALGADLEAVLLDLGGTSARGILDML